MPSSLSRIHSLAMMSRRSPPPHLARQRSRSPGGNGGGGRERDGGYGARLGAGQDRAQGSRRYDPRDDRDRRGGPGRGGGSGSYGSRDRESERRTERSRYDEGARRPAGDDDDVGPGRLWRACGSSRPSARPLHHQSPHQSPTSCPLASWPRKPTPCMSPSRVKRRARRARGPWASCSSTMSRQRRGSRRRAGGYLYSRARSKSVGVEIPAQDYHLLTSSADMIHLHRQSAYLVGRDQVVWETARIAIALY